MVHPQSKGPPRPVLTSSCSEAVNSQVMLVINPKTRRPLVSVRPTVAFPASELHHTLGQYLLIVLCSETVLQIVMMQSITD